MRGHLFWSPLVFLWSCQRFTTKTANWTFSSIFVHSHGRNLDKVADQVLFHSFNCVLPFIFHLDLHSVSHCRLPCLCLRPCRLPLLFLHKSRLLWCRIVYVKAIHSRLFLASQCLPREKSQSILSVWALCWWCPGQERIKFAEKFFPVWINLLQRTWKQNGETKVKQDLRAWAWGTNSCFDDTGRFNIGFLNDSRGIPPYFVAHSRLLVRSSCFKNVAKVVAQKAAWTTSIATSRECFWHEMRKVFRLCFQPMKRFTHRRDCARTEENSRGKQVSGLLFSLARICCWKKLIFMESRVQSLALYFPLCTSRNWVSRFSCRCVCRRSGLQHCEAITSLSALQLTQITSVSQHEIHCEPSHKQLES